MPASSPTRRRFLAQAFASSIASSPPSIIDTHVHVFRRDPAFPYAAGSNAPAQDAPAETLLELMQRNGVAGTVLVQVIHYKWDNRYVHSVLRQFPGRFHAVCRVDPQNPAAPDHLSVLTAQGFRGVRLSPAASAEGDWIRGPLMPALWRRCADLGVPMTILTTPPRLPDLIPHLEANPTLPVVIDHMAECPLNDPTQLASLLALARYPHVYLKLSDLWTVSHEAYPFRDTFPHLRRILDTFGAHRSMAASNWPVSLKSLSYAQAIALPRDHLPFLSPRERRQILSGTAQTLWPFPSPSIPTISTFSTGATPC